MSVPVRRRTAAITGGVAAVLLLAACGSSSSGGNSSPSPTDAACQAYSTYGWHPGTTVTMNGSIISPESDSLAKSWQQFEQCTGITIKYNGSNDFESQLSVKVQGGTAPDIAIIPQPGLIQKMVKTGKAIPADCTVSANVDKYWNPAWKSYATVDGKFYGAPMSANLKSLVWFSPSTFKTNGWTIPTTWDQLMALSDTIAKSGKMKPWCGGIGSGTATGWPATDWIEEIVLRQSGGQVYDDWITHKVTFSSPQITSAFKTLEGWMRNPAWVNGGFGDSTTIATTIFQDAGKPILTNKCAMLQQASFYGAQFPKGTTVGADGQVFAFYLPPMGTQFGSPVEGGGEFQVAFADRPEVHSVLDYLSTPEWATSRVKVASGWVSANNGVPVATYTDPIDALSAKYLTDPSATFRFDASDLMPAAVGNGSFWKGMTAFFGENKSTADVTAAIDASWPS